MFGCATYFDGQNVPERGWGANWHVWCNTGANKVLKSREYLEWLSLHPEQEYIINFANGSAAHICPTDQLWQVMKSIASDYSVEVFPLALEGRYQPWTGDSGSIAHFDAIRIKAKPS